MVLVSLMVAVPVSTYGLLQQPLMNLVATTRSTVLVPIGISPPLPHHHQVLFGMITSVTLAVQIIINTFSMVMIHYGMEQVVDQITTAVTSTILRGFASNCHPLRLIISRCVYVVKCIPMKIPL
jgi:hypothetical protein